MKRVIQTVVAILLLLPLTAAIACNLDASLINQDPYPAIPGDYVKVVFQLDGVGNPECGNIQFSLIEEFPFSLDPEENAITELIGGAYARNYESFAIIPYEIRVHEDALDGSNPLEVVYGSKATASTLERFQIEVQDVKTDFEVYITDYYISERKLVFGILNTGKNDVEALTVEIPKQENIEVKGSNRAVVGSLDSNDDTSFSFEAIPQQGEISLKILYTDEINERRELDKTVYYDPTYFTGRIRDVQTTPTSIYILLAIALILIIWKIRSVMKRKKKEKLKELEIKEKLRSSRHKKH